VREGTDRASVIRDTVDAIEMSSNGGWGGGLCFLSDFFFSRTIFQLAFGIAYVNNLNVAEEKLHTAVSDKDVTEEIAIQSAIKFNGGGKSTDLDLSLSLALHGSVSMTKRWIDPASSWRYSPRIMDSFFG
jgi:hypothetical protein